ncbi:MAG: TolC family protein [Bacteroidetes bacterium]|nr:TolC family protein [Bacteroidota bacterium]MDA1119885.1 TolC family protein [Bacteroidota bacterium]
MVRSLFWIILSSILYLLTSVTHAQSLDDYFKVAAENNPGLQARYKEFEVALQQVPKVSTLADPTFSFGYFISPVETRVGPQRARLSLTQMFPWFGTLKTQGDAATLRAEAKYQSFMDTRNRVFYQVASAYYPLYELNQWTQIEKQNIEILESYKIIATIKFENGTGTMVDVLRVDIMLKDAQTNLSILNKKGKPLITTFNTLLNRNEEEVVQVPDSLLVDNVTDNFRKDSLLFGNPALEALDLRMKASEADERAAFKQGLPKLGFGLDYIVVGEWTDLGPAVAPPADNGKNAFMPTFSMSIPIFRGKYKASIKEEQLMQESYSLQKDEYANTLLSSYEMTWFEIQQQMELISLYDQQTKESNRILSLLFTEYGNSGEEFEEVLNMQQQLLKYEKMKASAEVQYQNALAKLNYLTAKTY